jgi:hypothetical protein
MIQGSDFSIVSYSVKIERHLHSTIAAMTDEVLTENVIGPSTTRAFRVLKAVVSGILVVVIVKSGRSSFDTCH